MIDLDTLLADPPRRPPEGWSVRAEARRLRRDLALYPHQARQTGKETNR